MWNAGAAAGLVVLLESDVLPGRGRSDQGFSETEQATSLGTSPFSEPQAGVRLALLMGL